MKTFGRIDYVVNNAGALILRFTPELSMKQYDLMQAITVRGAFVMVKYAIPYLLQSDNPHVMFMVPPVDLTEDSFFSSHLGYTMSKFGAGLMMRGLAAEFRGKIGSNSLWPRTVIKSNAIINAVAEELTHFARSPTIMGKAALVVFKSDAAIVSGNAFVDDEVLISSGEETVTTLDKYNVNPQLRTEELSPDLLV